MQKEGIKPNLTKSLTASLALHNNETRRLVLNFVLGQAAKAERLVRAFRSASIYLPNSVEDSKSAGES